MFSTNVMNEQTENNKQTNCFLKIFIRKPMSLPLKAIHVTLTGWSGSEVPLVKSAEYMAKINTKIMSQIGRISHFFLENSIKNI